MSELPNGWVETDLGSIALINEKIDVRDKPDDLEVTFLPMGRVDEESGNVDYSETRLLGNVRKGYTQFIDNDVIFAKITPCMENGKVAVVSNLKNGLGYGSTEFHVFRLYSEISPDYLFHFLVQKSFRYGAERNMRGAVGQKRVPPEYMVQSKIPLPPLAEQKRIVEKIEALFSRLDAGIAALEKTKAQLKRYKQSVLKAAFEGKYTTAKVKKDDISIHFPAGLGEFNVPSSWSQLTVGDVTVSMKNGIYKPSSFYRDLEGTPCLRMYNIEKGLINFKNLKYMELTSDEIDDYALLPGDLLVNRVNSKELVGKTALITFDHSCVFESKNIRLRLKDELIIPAYLNFWFLLFGQYYFNFNSQQVVGMASISQGQIASFPLSLPKKEEQLVIISEIERQNSTADKVLETVEQELRKAQALKSKILEYTFTGKLVPQNPDDEPAEKLLERIKAEKESSKPTKKTIKRK